MRTKEPLYFYQVLKIAGLIVLHCLLVAGVSAVPFVLAFYAAGVGYVIFPAAVALLIAVISYGVAVSTIDEIKLIRKGI